MLNNFVSFAEKTNLKNLQVLIANSNLLERKTLFLVEIVEANRKACRINLCRLAKPGTETRRTVDILFCW